MPAFGLVPVVAAAALVVCFLAAMAVCVYIVRKTDDTEGLRHLADVIRAFWRKPK